MGTALTDALIDLASPTRQAFFRRDPEGYCREQRLSDAEARALSSSDFGTIWVHAQSMDSPEPDQQFNRNLRYVDALIEVDPIVDVTIEQNVEITALGHTGQLIVDEAGTYFRIMLKAA